MRRRLKYLAACVASSALALLFVSSASAHHLSHHVSVTTDGTNVTLSRDVIRAGKDRFFVKTTAAPSQEGGNGVTLWQPKRGVSLDQVYADLREEFSNNPATAAQGTRDLVRDIKTYGLAEVSPGHPELVTENLRCGDYYLFDLSNYNGTGTPTTTKLRVVGHGHRHFLRGNTFVKLTSSDRFRVSDRYMPHRGSYVVKNVSDTIHFAELAPVKKGTTDKEIQDYFNNPQGPPPFFIPGPSGGNDVLTPGQEIQVNYNLPRGDYVFLCFVADDQTGMPHAFMGMHKVVHLR